jgi:hypothetical protein
MMDRRFVLFVVSALALGGCGGAFAEEVPPKPPDRDQLSRIAATTRQPAYWLGPSFRQITVSSATARRHVYFSYGPWTCNSGCSPSGGVLTGRRDTAGLVRIDVGGHIDPRKCWSRARRAVVLLVDCLPDGYPQELLVFTGSRAISVTSLYTPDGKGEIPAREVLRALRPLNRNAPWPLPAPRHLSCKEFRRLDGRYRRYAPAVLRPRNECGLAQQPASR